MVSSMPTALSPKRPQLGPDLTTGPVVTRTSRDCLPLAFRPIGYATPLITGELTTEQPATGPHRLRERPRSPGAREVCVAWTRTRRHSVGR